MEAHLADRLVSFSSKKVREMSEEIKEELETEYNYFFQMILDEVIGAITTPGVLSPYVKWKPLSNQWVKYKGTNEHYVGLSNSQTMGRALRRRGSRGMSRLRANGPMPAGAFKVGSFQSYIQSLNKAGTTARFFGPISVSYDFVTPSANFKVTPLVENGIVKQTLVRSAQRGQFVAFPKTLKMQATITAFGKLKGVQFDEWHIVDYILKRIDPANEKQWVKINSQYGFGRSRRPIRAVITPILKYYLERRFPEIVRAAIKARST